MSLEQLIFGSDKADEKVNKDPDDHRESSITPGKKRKRPKKGAQINGNTPEDAKRRRKELRSSLQTERSRIDNIYHFASPATSELSKDPDSVRRHVLPPLKPQRKKKDVTPAAKEKMTKEFEWRSMKDDWKNRKFDLREEEDVGGAIARGIAAMVADEDSHVDLDNPKPKKKRSAAKSTGGTVPEETPSTQASVLDQLLSSQPDVAEFSEEKEKPVSFQESLSRWDQGKHADREGSQKFRLAEELEFRATPLLAGPVASEDDIEESSYLILSNFPDIGTQTHPASMFADCDERVFVNPTFAHSRNIRKLAARHVAQGRDPERDTITLRLLKMLWQKPDSAQQILASDSRQSSMIRAWIAQNGRQMHTFLSHRWKNRRKAAELLGLTPSRQLEGPDEYHGYSTQPHALLASVGKSDCSQVAEALGQKEIRWDNAKPSAGQFFSNKPQTQYMPTPGSIPPDPIRPLDIHGVIFGPEDQYNCYDTYGVVDESTFRLTHAFLLGLLSEDNVDEIRQQIEFFMKRSMELVGAKGRNQSAALKEQPKALLYTFCLACISWLLNDVSFRPEVFDEQRQDVASDASYQEAQEIGDGLAREPRESVLATTFEFCKARFNERGLERFTRLGTIAGLLRIAKHLPASAATILADSLRVEMKTPFHLFASTLDFLEESALLSDTEAKGQVCASTLDFAFHQAGEIFKTCIAREPFKFELRCWFVATLAASLLLCSGNRIGSGAHMYPASNTGNKDIGSHEVRKKLPKFQELRRTLAKEMLLLVGISQKDGVAIEVHLAMTCLLEWHQVMALLLGPHCKRHMYSSLCDVHAFHRSQLVKTIDYTSMQLIHDPELPSIEKAARLVELRPSSSLHWLSLALLLGPIGDPSDFPKCTVMQRQCNDCAVLSKGRLLSHKKRAKRQNHDSHWWGNDRIAWWNYTVLDLDHSGGFKLIMGQHKTKVLTLLETEFADLGPMEVPLTRDGPFQVEKATAKITEQLKSICAESPKARPSYPNLKERMNSIEAYLPVNCLNKKESAPKLPFQYTGLEDVSEEDQITSCKIVVASHLYNPSHAWVQSKIINLIRSAWNAKQGIVQGSSLHALRWLYRMGIDATRVYKLASRERDYSTRRNVAHPLPSKSEDKRRKPAKLSTQERRQINLAKKQQKKPLEDKSLKEERVVL